MALDEILSLEDTRTIANDWTVRHENRLLQILKDNKPLPRPKERVIVRTLLDGNMQLLYRDKKLKFEPIIPSIRPLAGDIKHKGAESVSSFVTVRH